MALDSLSVTSSTEKFEERCFRRGQSEAWMPSCSPDILCTRTASYLWTLAHGKFLRRAEEDSGPRAGNLGSEGHASAMMTSMKVSRWGNKQEHRRFSKMQV